MRGPAVVVLLLGLLAAACSTPAPPDAETAPETIRVTSQSFAGGEAIPTEHTCEGQDIPPSLAWSGGPAAQEYAVAVLDPDAGDFVHWIVFGIPGTVQQLVPGSVPSSALEGANDFNRIGYGGPCPPPGDDPHDYEFTVYALSASVAGRLRAAATPDEFFRVIGCCLAAKGILVGTFGR
jgi:Raf kinase inhibitor-like YbhB/YbcL family protein